jgi:UDP-N-acetylglucosamine 2-epimerase
VPTSIAMAILVRENVSPSHVYVTGNTVVDALMTIVSGNYYFGDDLNSVDCLKHRVLLVTKERRENLGEPLRDIYQALILIVQ